MFRFTPQTIPGNIFVIGGGGTGSRLMPMLTQFIRSITRGVSPTGWVEKPTIWVVDDDTVEQKNLLRQNFIQNDVGKPKATVLAERYGRAYDVDVIPIVKRVDASNNFASAVNEILEAKRAVNATLLSRDNAVVTNVNSVLNSSMVIICVDSSEARRHILNTFITHRKSTTTPGSFFIDAGNEDSFGQVNFFTPTLVHGLESYERLSEDQKLPKLIGSICDVDFIPMNVEYYRTLEDTPAQGSCADLNQTLAINAMMATTIMGVVQNYYYRKTFTYNCIRLSLDGANATEYNTFNHFKRISLKTISETDSYADNRVNSNTGGRIRLTFSKGLQFVHLVNTAYTLLKDKIYRDEEEAAAQRRKEALELKKAKIEEERQAARDRAISGGKCSTTTSLTVNIMPEGKVAKPGKTKIRVVAGERESIWVQEVELPISAQLPPVMPPMVMPNPTPVQATDPAPRRRRTIRESILDQATPTIPETWTIPEPTTETTDLMARAVESVEALRRNL